MNKFVLTLDDYSPRPGTNDLTWCNKLIEAFPDIKIDLFVPAAYARLGDKRPFYLHEHQDWVERTKKLPSNYRLNLHGFFHRRSKKDWAGHTGSESNNNEWERIDYNQSGFWLDKIRSEFRKADLKHTNVFRAPGWHIGRGAVKLLADQGFLIAGNDEYFQKFKDIPNLKWKNYNWDMMSACSISKGDIVTFGHTSEWTGNCMDKERYELIIDLLKRRKLEFSFVENC